MECPRARKHSIASGRSRQRARSDGITRAVNQSFLLTARSATGGHHAPRHRRLAPCLAGPARRGRHRRRARSGADPPARVGLLGVEDAAERRRARRLHRAGRRAARRRDPSRPAGAASPRDARLPRRARGARHAAARRARLRRHPRDAMFLDRESPAYIGGMLEMANDRLYGVLGLADGGAAHRPAAERDQDGRGLLRRPLRRPGAAAAVHALHDRPEHGRLTCDRRQVPLARARDVRRRRHRGGRAAGDGRSRARAHLGRRLGPARSRARCSTTTSPASGSQTGCASIPASSSPTRCRTPT